MNNSIPQEFLLQGEVFRAIPDYLNYSISNYGRIVRTKKRGGSPCLLLMRQPIGKSGYPQIGLTKNKKQTIFLTHRLVMLVFVGACPEGWQCHHKNHIKTDNRLDNLEYVTPSYNTQAAYDAGVLMAAHGETHYNAKLLDSQVRQIRELSSTGNYSRKTLAKMFGCSRESIRDIVRGKRRANV